MLFGEQVIIFNGDWVVLGEPFLWELIREWVSKTNHKPGAFQKPCLW